MLSIRQRILCTSTAEREDEDAQCSSKNKLKALHNFELRHASLHLVEDVSIQGLVLRLSSESRFVWCDVLWVLHAVASTSDDLRELSVPCPLPSSEADLLVGVAVGGVVGVVDHVCVVGRRLAHVIDYAVFLGQLAAYGFDRVNVSNFCHSFVRFSV